MSSDHSSDVLPMLTDGYRGFAQALRGYDRAQVDTYLGQLEDDLRAAGGERDAAQARSADLAAQLASAQAHLESLRRQLRMATETVTPENIDERVRHLLESAQADATRIRNEATADAERVRNGASDAAARTKAAAQADADRIVAEATARLAEADETFRRRIAEADQHRIRVEAELAERVAQTRADEERLTLEAEAARHRLDDEARAERERLDAESARTRQEAEDDFEIVLRQRRTEQHAQLAEQRAAAEEEARQLIADAKAEVARLYRHREVVHGELRALHGKIGDALDVPLAPPPGE